MVAPPPVYQQRLYQDDNKRRHCHGHADNAGTEGGGRGRGAAGGSGAGSSGQSQSTAASNGSGSGPLSKNYLKDGQNSTSVVNSASQTPEPLYETNETGSGSGNNGGKELSLSAVDNKAALRAQIKALMDVEKDPAVKDELLKQYEALK
jgi:hypothetical protein